MIYLDASAAVSQFVEDTHTPQAQSFFAKSHLVLGVSDFCVAEFIAAVAQHVRARRYSEVVGRMAIDDFEKWIEGGANRLQLSADDVGFASNALRRFDLKIRAPDAVHLAICQRVGARLLSFDHDQIAAAIELGIPLAR